MGKIICQGCILLSGITAWLVGGCAAAFLLLGGIEQFRIHNLNADLVEANNDKATCAANLATAHANTTELQASITAQNAKITALEVAAAAQADRANAAAAAALKTWDSRAGDAASIGTGPTAMNAWLGRFYK